MEKKMENTVKPVRRFEWELPVMLLIMLIGYVLIHDLIGGTLFSHSGWDSYTLQALAWRSGSLYLEENYPWLELAVYNGHYFVSFPPLPSVVMLPLTYIFGENTPNNFVMVVYALLTATLAYRALRGVKTQPAYAAFFACFYVWGSNMLWMSTNGGVWFQAQSLNLLLLTGALLAAQRNKRIAAYALTALAVGCRPFSAVAFLPLAVWFYTLDKKQYGGSFIKTACRQLTALIIPACIAAAYMWYNYARFGSILEFGHNYLPEFTESELGQFNLRYIPENLYNIFLRPIKLAEGAALEYPVFDGFMFYVANPLFLMMFIRVIIDIAKKRMEINRIILLVSIALGILLLCAHKTFGGWQFGARYTVDVLPMALGIMLLSGGGIKKWEFPIMIFAIMLNAYGALAMNFLYG